MDVNTNRCQSGRNIWTHTKHMTKSFDSQMTNNIIVSVTIIKRMCYRHCPTTSLVHGHCSFLKSNCIDCLLVETKTAADLGDAGWFIFWEV